MAGLHERLAALDAALLRYVHVDDAQQSIDAGVRLQQPCRVHVFSACGG